MTSPASDMNPATLALFTHPVPPPGRTRGSFSMTGPAHQPTPPRGPARDTPILRPRVERVVADGIDWELVDRLRSDVSDLLAERDPSDDDRHRVGREIIDELLEQESRLKTSRGEPTWTIDLQEQLAQAIFDAVFRLGRLQPYLDNPDIENVIISGYDNVQVEDKNGRLVPASRVADTDEQLVQYIAFLAQHQPRPRDFSEASPALHLALPDRARMFASAWVTARPTVILRRNRLASASLSDLVDRGSLSAIAASFLSAAVKSRMSLVVSGDQGSGKTTMLRCLAHEIPRHVQIGTIETDFELYLKDTGDHLVVHEWQANPGTGEAGLNGRRAGEYSVRDALEDSLRANLSYTIVGEVRGSEIVTMFKCMQSGSGSMSTTHARTAEGAIRKLVTCATQEGANITREYALNVIAEDIDIIMQLQVDTEELPDGTTRKHRWVSEIIAVEPGEQAKGYATTTIFQCRPGERRAVATQLPTKFHELVRHGFDLEAFQAELSQRGAA